MARREQEEGRGGIEPEGDGDAAGGAPGRNRHEGGPGRAHQGPERVPRIDRADRAARLADTCARQVDEEREEDSHANGR